VCGRYTLASAPEVLAEQFGLAEAPSGLAPRYNIAPGQTVAAVRAGAGDARVLDSLHWGLIPAWAKDPTIGRRLINARVETLAVKPAFRDALRHRRCLLPADGFYEWQRRDGVKQPHWIARADRRPFGLAGLWERWRDAQGEIVESCTIVTTQAGPVLRDVHERMPLIVPAEHYARWLDPGRADARALLALLGAGDWRELQAQPVSLAVNNPRRDEPNLIQALT